MRQQPSKLFNAGSSPAGVANFEVYMKLKVYSKNILCLTFPNQKEMTLTFCRPQEYYECNSKKLRNKFFTFSEFLDHYLNKDGHITYFSYWAGFNIPGHVLEKFFEMFDLSEQERVLYNITRKYSGNPYYLIGTRKNDASTLKHELVHAYYYLDQGYRQEVNTIVKHMRPNLKKQISSTLQEMGYNKTVMVDEINAYMSTSSTKYLREDLQLEVSRKDTKPFVELSKTVLRD